MSIFDGLVTPALAVANLDAALAQTGQPVTLRRLVGTASPTAYDVTAQAFVRGYAPKEIVGGIQQGDTLAILSPSEIVAAGWPGAGAQSDGTDTRVPRNGDRLVIAGRIRRIEAAVPLYMAGALVRIELQLRG